MIVGHGNDNRPWRLVFNHLVSRRLNEGEVFEFARKIRKNCCFLANERVAGVNLPYRAVTQIRVGGLKSIYFTAVFAYFSSKFKDFDRFSP
jgi:hypothetical protein